MHAPSIGKAIFRTGCLAAALAVAAIMCVPAASGDNAARTGLERYLDADDALLVTAADGRTLAAVRADRPMVPASTLKLLTALVALDILGPDYRFPTDLLVDNRADLILKGYGDPRLISESLAEMAAQTAAHLAAEKIAVADLVVDDSFFATRPSVPGVTDSRQPYDAPNGAVCANFNTVLYATAKGRRISAEPQTPLIDFARRRIPAGAPDRGRITLSHDSDAIALYAGHLFARFLADAGAAPAGTVRRGSAPAGETRRLFTYRSPFPLTRVVAGMLEFSNNFTANQILIAAGAARFGPPGTLAKGVAAAAEMARNRLGIESLTLVEGSGISRKNRISARDMDRVLQAFAPRRELMRRRGPERFKTGTLNGIRTRAGYIDTAGGSPVRYVIFTTGRKNRTEALADALRRRLGGK